MANCLRCHEPTGEPEVRLDLGAAKLYPSLIIYYPVECKLSQKGKFAMIPTTTCIPGTCLSSATLKNHVVESSGVKLVQLFISEDRQNFDAVMLFARVAADCDSLLVEKILKRLNDAREMSYVMDWDLRACDWCSQIWDRVIPPFKKHMNSEGSTEVVPATVDDFEDVMLAMVPQKFGINPDLIVPWDNFAQNASDDSGSTATTVDLGLDSTGELDMNDVFADV